MCPKGKRPSSEDDETRTLLRSEKSSKTEAIEILSEEVRRKLKIDDSIPSRVGPASAIVERLKGMKPSPSYSSPNVERKEGSRFMDNRTVVWKASLRQGEVSFGKLIIPVRSAGALYTNAEKVSPGRKNARWATVEDDWGRSWKMLVELRSNKLILHCDKFLTQNGLQPNDKISLFHYHDSHSRYHIGYVKLRQTRFRS